MISFRHKGDFSKATQYLLRIKDTTKISVLEKYAQEGVTALSAATPIDTGKTATSWGYRIEKTNSTIRLVFTNSNINKGVNVAVILQYGHGTGTGGWIEGRDYINPAIQPIFDKIAKEAWEEVTRV